ncbi:YciI-like protein [Sulfurospirillum sp. UCH001]|uniref:YciI-like protein n=1 Tax=Sulfurospirillum sp. UCH001 TaxID=1581011 RepID=UPI000833C2E6|nr:YciI-like protein [Sulfurospirillum sp. UCH001]
MYYILFYNYVDNIIEKRVPFREAHLALATSFVESGELLLGGAFANPADGAILIFKVENKAQVEAFVKQDPYVQNGLVTSWNIREWSVVVGAAL